MDMATMGDHAVEGSYLQVLLTVEGVQLPGVTEAEVRYAGVAGSSTIHLVGQARVLRIRGG